MKMFQYKFLKKWRSIGICNYLYIKHTKMKKVKKMMTGGVKNPNASVMVQKTPGGRVGGGNASAQVQRVAKGRSGGGNKSAEVSPKRKG